MAGSDSDKQIEELIDIGEGTLPLKRIDAIANDDGVRMRYEGKYGNTLYPTILKSLTHEIFSEEEAFRLWKAIVDHRNELNRILGREVGVPVAAMDYLLNIKDKLSDPKIIEEEKMGFVTETTLRDDLTGLLVREVFDTLLKKEISRAERNETELCLLMMDIDDFKRINDTHGHLKGDEVLRKIGHLVQQSIRQMDVAARYGGEELVVIMPDTDMFDASQVGERIRRAIEQLDFDDFNVTVSMGISEFGRSNRNPENMIAAADAAMYRAKRAGKNRIERAAVPANGGKPNDHKKDAH